jgi:1-phosphatidylinositol-4-phosphate 5-kinase
VIKTLTHNEARFLRQIAPEYERYMLEQRNCDSLLPRLYGFYKLRYNNQQLYFVLMNNLFPTALKIHQKFDLKGSSVGRSVTPSELKRSEKHGNSKRTYILLVVAVVDWYIGCINNVYLFIGYIMI